MQEQVVPATANLAFERWIGQFRARALARGISAATFDRAFQGIEYNTDVIQKDRNQSEFTKTIWDYLDSAASPTRVRERQGGAAQIRPRAGPDRGPIRRRQGGRGGDLGAGERLWQPSRQRADRRGAGDARLRRPPRQLLRGPADRRAEDHPARGRDGPRHDRVMGRRDGPHPVHPVVLPRLSRSISAATASATSGPTTRPTRWLRRPPTSLISAGSRASPGGSRSACRRASTTASPGRG